MDLGLFFADFCRCGREIFDFPAAMIEMFRKTDVDDIPLAAIKAPYPCFYLYFGPQRDLETKPGWHPDGAYVAIIGAGDNTVMQMALTSAPPDEASYAAWLSNPEPAYVQAVAAERLKLGVGEATDLVLSDKMAELRKQIANPPGDGMIREAVESLGGEGTRLDGMEFSDNTANFARKELEGLPALHAAWQQMLRLVVNALAYLSAYPEDIRTEWPKKAPQDLCLKLQNGSPKQQQRARSHLAALGFTAIHLCGKGFRDQPPEAGLPSAPGEQAPRKQTWVRGHWYNQAYGPQHSLRRLKWRMPHLRGGEESPDEPGHIYLVD
jgi:hypothetical protein